MCWNQYVSLNTFIFGIFGLLFILYNNLYSPYKLKEFKTIGTYFFFMSFILMQGIEYVLWKNIKNKKTNHLYSFYAALLVFIQPIASLFFSILPYIQILSSNNQLSLFHISFHPSFLYLIS